jgi:hypothetical protein
MMYKHIDAFLYLGAHEFRNSGRGSFCWEVDPVWLRHAISSAIAARMSAVGAGRCPLTFPIDHIDAVLLGFTKCVGGWAIDFSQLPRQWRSLYSTPVSLLF